MGSSPGTGELDRRLVQALGARLAAGAREAPDAAAIALREVLAAAPDLPRGLVVDLWRRLEAEADPRPVALWGAAPIPGLHLCGPARTVADPAEALTVAEAGGRAVLAIGAGVPWWGRMLARPGLRVVGTLPELGHGPPAALIVTAERPGPTGDDRTFWVTDAAGPPAAVIARLSAVGLAADLIEAAGGLKLFALAGYVQGEDARLDAAPGGLSGVIGAAPVF